MIRVERERELNHPEFSYRYYRNFLGYLNRHFEIVQGKDLVHGTEKDVQYMPRIFLRHDVDISPGHALKMAQVEYAEGIKSTYHFMVDSPLYSLANPETKAICKEIESLGHEIGLHIDIGADIRNSAYSMGDLEQQLRKDAERLEAATGTPVTSFSFHRQGEKISGSHNQTVVAGIVNAFASDVGTISNGRFISDSRGVWSTDIGSALSQFAQTKSLIQLVVHPIWWGESSLSTEQRIVQVYKDLTQGKTKQQAIEIELGLRQILPKSLYPYAWGTSR